MYVLDIDQLTAYLTDMLETDPILSDVWVRGEITSFFESRAGHCYFTLSGARSQLKAVLFKGNRFHIGQLPSVGDSVVAHGRVSIYADQGQYQLYVDFISGDGVGLLQLQFEELRQRLEAEGLFDLSRKRPIPELPRVIGLVTSPQGAVLHDILTVLRRRFPAVEVVVSPSMVQGAGAPESLVSALERLWELEECDVIIIARGGGAPEELAVFNSEILARAIFRSPVPVISAVGHETDTTIADYVADLRAPTPSAAAELVVPDRRDVKAAIDARFEEMSGWIERYLDERRVEIERRCARLKHLSPTREIERHQRSVEMLQLRGATAVRRCIEQAEHRLESRVLQLQVLDPRAVLARGYAAVETVDGKTRLRSAAAASREEALRIVMSDGDLIVRPSGRERA